VLGSGSWDRLAEDGNSENFHGEGRRLAAEDFPQSCPAASIAPLAAEGPDRQRERRV